MALKKRVAEKGYSQRHTNVLLEHMDKKFDLVLEGHEALRVSLEKKIEAEAATLREEFRKEILSLHHETSSSFVSVREYLSRIDDEIQEMGNEFRGRAEAPRVLELERKMKRVYLVLEKKFGKEWNF